MDFRGEEETPAGEATELLASIAGGDPAAWPRLYEIVYEDLKRAAAALLRRERAGHTLQTIDLIDEAYLRLIHQDRTPRNRGHFVEIAATAMRRVLVDYAKARSAQKRGGGQVRVDLPEDYPRRSDGKPLDVTAVDAHLSELERLHPESARVVNLRFFAGLSVEETARALGLSTGAVQRTWEVAKQFLSGRLRREGLA